MTIIIATIVVMMIRSKHNHESIKILKTKYQIPNKLTQQLEKAVTNFVKNGSWKNVEKCKIWKVSTT